MKRIFLSCGALAALFAFITLGFNETVNILSLSIANCSSTIQESQEELDYMVGTWSSPVTKEEAQQITSIMDFWSDEDKVRYKHDAFRDIWVVNLKDYPDWTLDVSEIEPRNKAESPTEIFTNEQLALVANANYSDHLRFSAIFNSTNIETGQVEENALVSQSMSLVPDVQAKYEGGLDALVSFLKKASKDEVKHVKRDKVGRCRIFFTVTDTGAIINIKMVESSNYSDVDEALIKILEDLPQMWTPAQDINGWKVDQEFVFTFGSAGC